jgi:cytoplasmic iron level regulating protein YaaA (DUF328/UPF0246 family)
MKRFLLCALCSAGLALAAQEPGQVQVFPAQGTKVQMAEGKVEKVYSLEEDGFSYIAYEVSYHNVLIIVNDLTAQTHFKIGDSIKFTVMKNDFTKIRPGSKKIISFNAVYVGA